MQSHVTRAILFDYFKGNATVLQKHELEAWLSNPANQDLYFEYWWEFEKERMQWFPNEQVAFDKIKLNLRNSDLTIRETAAPNKFPRRRFWALMSSIAAVFVLTFLFSDLLLWKSVETGYGETKSLVLSDGSLVVLNANSVLKTARFESNAGPREVRLDGEAYFTVRHTEDDRKFVVRTSDDFKVEVLGTEFSVKNRKSGVQVLLDKGKVQVHYAKISEAITMNPGDLLTLDERGEISKAESKELKEFSAWRSKKFVFNKTSISELGQMILDNYGLKMVIKSDELNERTISGEIEAQNVEELLSAISSIFDLTITRNNEIIEIKTKHPML